MRTIKKQADLDAGLKAGEWDFVIEGDIELVVSGAAAPTLRAYGNSQPRVVASGNSQPRVLASDS